MNLSEKGWFKRLISSQAGLAENKIDDLNEYLYKTSHNSGLIYGHPVLPKEFKSAEFLEMPQPAKLKLVLLDGFIKTAVFPSDEHIPDDPDEFVHYLSESIIEYYSEVIPNKKIKDRNFWGKKLNNEEIVEALLNDRLNSDTSEIDNFWISFFNNSLLFLDVFFFGEWIANRHEEATVQKIQQHRDDVHLLLLQVMASAAYADNTIQEEEKVLFNQFLASTHLPEKMEKTAADYIIADCKGTEWKPFNRQVIPQQALTITHYVPAETGATEQEQADRCLSCASCRDCHLCETICPTGAISRRELESDSLNNSQFDSETSYEYISDDKKCIACGFCADTCPCGIWTMNAF